MEACGRWLRDYGPLLLAWACVQVVLAGAIGFWAGWWPWQRRLGALVARLLGPPPSAGRAAAPAIELVGADVRRLRAAFGQQGMRFAK